VKGKKQCLSDQIRRDDIIDVLKQRFAEKMNANVPIFGIEKKDLKEFTTTEKDMRKGQNRFPPTQMRIKAEDLLKETVES
jgi:indole-3-glycerol phosphate synthase